MPSKALSIANGLASLFGSGARQGASTKQSDNAKKQYDSGISDETPLAERMVRKANPEKRALAANSLANAFKK